jgi:mannose-6-phosphate isomerase-like protein (cupin superfamily)
MVIILNFYIVVFGGIVMQIKNFLEIAPVIKSCHEGIGTVKESVVFKNEEFLTNLRFLTYMEIPSGSSIGYHKHGENEEAYIILEGSGIMTVDNEEREVKKGDMIINKPQQSHGLKNNSKEELKILVFEVKM